MMGNAGKIAQMVVSGKTDDIQVLSLIEAARKGIAYRVFAQLARTISFSMQDWSYVLNVSDRTLQRLKKENRAFDQKMSERIFQIAILNSRGTGLMGNHAGFISWLESENVALGGIKPKELLDSTFGIEMLSDELSRIEHGILA